MARNRKTKPESADAIPLIQPDRSGPSGDTLLKFAQDQDLFEQAKKREAVLRKQAGKPAREDDVSGKRDLAETAVTPEAERFLEALLWSVSLAVLHTTFDVLVQHQYAIEISWHGIVLRSLQALCGACASFLPTILAVPLTLFAVFFFLIYILHPFASHPTFLPTRLVPARFQGPLRQALFFVVSLGAGCYLIHITNTYGYMAVMKQAPSLGCLWIWAVIEMDLLWAVPSLAVIAAFVWLGDYSIRTGAQ